SGTRCCVVLNTFPSTQHMLLSELKTPSLIIDLDRVKKNAARIGEIAKRNNVRLRPHIKTHKCIEVGRLQTEGFDGAITVSTLAETRAFVERGFSDITYAVPIESGKIADSIDILRGGVKLNLLTDDGNTVRQIDGAAGRAGVK